MSRCAVARKFVIVLKCRKILILFLVMAGLFFIVSPVFGDSQVTASTNLVLAKGDPVIISGNGYTNGSVSLWGIGPAFFTHLIIETTPKGTINVTFERESTRDFRSGPLFIIIEDPGTDRTYSLTAVEESGKYKIYGSHGEYLITVDPKVLNISMAQACAGHLVDLIESEGTDDSYITHQLYVEEPALHLEENSESGKITVPVGQILVIQGSMNMAIDNPVSVKIEKTSHIERTGQHIPERTGIAKTTIDGDLRNRWEYSFNTTGFSPGEYLMEIGWDRSGISGQNAAIIRIISNEKPSALMESPEPGDLSEKNCDDRNIFPPIRASRTELPENGGGILP